MQRRRLAAQLRARNPAEPPFAGTVPADAARHAMWAEPELVGLAEFTGWIDFADLSRAADQTGPTTLGRELAAVEEYLRLEQARFGRRLQVALDAEPELHAVPLASMQLLGVVRGAVQQGIEPRPDGGLLSLTARPVGGGCEVRVTGGDGVVTTLVLPS